MCGSAIVEGLRSWKNQELTLSDIDDIREENNITLYLDLLIDVFQVLCDVGAPPARNRMKDFIDGLNSSVTLLNPAAYRRLQLAVSTTLSSLMVDDSVDSVYGTLFDT